ncbi:MAG TPA: dihydroneopterin aldolase [Tenuifilaceae bacterium]|jgi:dihydroneopterin aldolase|nr:dihydroneopterin aldolase [Tenuifilaceae bacterium]HNY09844.1 dihydroneopterin aldolase [Tenuifilaceae bacterium]HPS05767.1 dihydroneopterin aldolase [Tenuifilaceae bacterium]HPW27429.1 dihydroneopterin aldolase [Tenuifilaceae bacterium]HQN84773.1 dihydroneopterin aldolase [Tenuifilaceae bacterium]
MAIIQLENMEFYAYHGHFAEEQVVGNRFLVDVSVDVDTTNAQHTDRLDDTVNYQHIYNLVSVEMQVKSKLLEHVAERIAAAIHASFPQVRSLKVKVSKMNPPLGGSLERVSVTLDRDFPL